LVGSPESYLEQPSNSINLTKGSLSVQPSGAQKQSQQVTIQNFTIDEKRKTGKVAKKKFKPVS